jgi:photosynthetic reaction center cytochrome c subunit
MSTIRSAAVWVAVLGVCALSACGERPPMDPVQRGYRGTGMVQVVNPRLQEKKVSANQVPEAVPAVPHEGPSAAQAYKNVQVLGDLSAAELARLMVAMTNWVAPKEGCTYCHAGSDLAADTLYTKVVARRMLQMTRHINSDWKTHVAGTGVTCFTCHRGQPVPANAWFSDPGPVHARGPAGNRAGQNTPAKSVGLTSLPYDPFTAFLDQHSEIRVVAAQALPGTDHHSIKDAESTYGLMMHLSQSLGVNCTYCHNSRSFFDWDASTPQRGTAWYGIRMVRDLNHAYLEPLAGQFPPNRLGPLGDVPKVNCGTCHQGVYKPLFGVSMLKDYPELAGPLAPAAAPASAPPAPAGKP